MILCKVSVLSQSSISADHCFGCLVPSSQVPHLKLVGEGDMKLLLELVRKTCIGVKDERSQAPAGD